MKHWVFCTLLLLGNVTAFSQWSYKELADLNTLCKKEDFEAAKTFLLNNGFIISSDKGSYDHGSYFVHAEIEAKRKIGNRNDFLLKGTDSDNMYDEITIALKEYEEYKELQIGRKVATNQPFVFVIKMIKNETIGNLKYETWTKVVLENKFSLGSRIPDATNNYVLPKLDGENIRQTFSKYELSEADNFTIYFFNDNQAFGDIKNVRIYNSHSQSRGKNYDPYVKIDSVTTNFYNFNFVLETKFNKGANVNSQTNSVTFPLIQKGKAYYLKIRFGNLVKTYILDSGASDMSIDDDTYNYLKKTNHLTIKDRLSIGKYQLADGSVVELKRINIPSFVIGNIEVRDIRATIVQNGKPLLLGKSFLDSFKSWKIDNNKQTLVVELF